MIASLAMYDWPQMRADHDRLWSRIAAALGRRGIAAPERLTRDTSLWKIWLSPDLLLALTCGLPYRDRLHGRVTLVGTPDYGLPDAPPGYYYSVFVTRQAEKGGVCDFLDRTLAYNGQDSQSGWAAAQNHVRPAMFRRVLHTGSHRASAEAVAAGVADTAAIDATTWRLITRFMPDIAARLRIIEATAPTPGLPLITALGNDGAALRAAFDEAVDTLPPDTRRSLGIGPTVTIAAEAYLSVPTPPLPSQDELAMMPT
ncbi:phosphonate ABC transporter substrate-binding protein [Albidovulum inexpectatum]|uniref:Phosphonate ABC transporter substrate-binding protein n=1 Tax=Albidovulum inexpectatum TaxID=196587 RepID=A0A2S5JFJ1_9RHOB|nr:PhnD/SsuA/transferrin family substrate-binding protein [Albidovulum inexpectatum]PPB80190.1 phosphonate ABC transporter substrate-binding protein [Albidovulum inexpectatum]